MHIHSAAFAVKRIAPDAVKKLRADGEGIGVFAAELAAKSFVDFTLVPVKEVARIASGEGGVTLTSANGNADFYPLESDSGA